MCSSPVTSFSDGRTGVLTLASAADGDATRTLVQKEGDMFVMGGRFQERFTSLHGVPAKAEWKSYLDSGSGTKLADWEKTCQASTQAAVERKELACQ